MLNTKQQLFAEHYIKLNDATKAAIAAGYSKKTASSQGHRLLKNAEVSAYIRERTEAVLRRVKMEADEVLERLAEHARGDIGVFIRVNEATGEPIIDMRGRGKPVHLIKRIKTKKTTSSGEGYDTTTTEVEFEMYDAQTALTTLARHHRLLTDKVQVDDWRRELEMLGFNPDAVQEKFVQFLEKELSEVGNAK